MENPVIEEILDSLAERYIPKGKHRLLHVDNREAWKALMEGLIEHDLITMKLSTFTKSAIAWETLLIHRLSILN
jgi:hypothetical protein